MEKVEGMLERLKLTAAEQKRIRIDQGSHSRSKDADPHAVGKVFVDKLAYADGLAQTLVRIWCSIKGVTCKDSIENLFLFSFHQVSGKRRALEEGPWMFGKDLEVMMDLDETKAIEEMEFVYFPVWVRVMKLPCGMMNKATGEAIGAEIGTFMTMDLDDDDTALGRYLRIKVRLDIRKPLMRGVTVCVGEKEKPLWCPLEYEFLPDFCYTCGIISHMDRSCEVQLAHGESHKFSKKLRCILDKRRMEDGGGRFGGGKPYAAWRSGSSGSRGGLGGYSSKSFPERSGSDAPSWQKDDGKGW
jgi:hypothetical protein